MNNNIRSSFSSESSQPWSGSGTLDIPSEDTQPWSVSSTNEPPELPTLDPRDLANIHWDAQDRPLLDPSGFPEPMGWCKDQAPLEFSAPFPDVSQEAGFMSDIELINHYYNEPMFDAEGGLQLFDIPSGYPPLPNSLGVYPEDTGFQDFDASFALSPTQGDMVGFYAPDQFPLMDSVAPEALAASSGGVEPAPPHLTTPKVLPSSQDWNLLDGRRKGLTYKQIKEIYGMQESESTLRGRYRSLTKPKEERVRKPVWLPNDIRLLKEAVEELRVVHNGTESVSWVRVADRIRERGSSYGFANATCKKKWEEVVGKAQK